LSLAHTTLRWRANPDIALREWGEAMVVYCGTTGATHLLDNNGAAILLSLRGCGAAMSAAEILEDTCGSPSLPPATDPEMLDILEQALQELAGYELVYRAES